MTTTASVYFNKIRVDYPQAGKDNDSQGFRDNFRNIFNAFSATNVLLENLDLYSIRKNEPVNDFGFNTIKKATLQSCVTKVVDFSPNSTSGNIFVDYNAGNYQKFSVSNGLSNFIVSNWPEGFAEMRIVVTPSSSSTTQISFGGNLVTVGSVEVPLVTNSTDSQTFNLWTDDQGQTIYIQGVDLNPATLVYDQTDTRSNDIEVAYTNGKYQKFELNTGTTGVDVLNWPASTNTVASLTLSFKTTTTDYESTLTFSSGDANVEIVGGHTYPYTFTTTSTQFFDIWTDNGGSTVYVLKKGL